MVIQKGEVMAAFISVGILVTIVLVIEHKSSKKNRRWGENY